MRILSGAALIAVLASAGISVGFMLHARGPNASPLLTVIYRHLGAHPVHCSRIGVRGFEAVAGAYAGNSVYRNVDGRSRLFGRLRS